MPVRDRRDEPMRCPSCGTRLVEVERSDVLIDACPECRGVWLDRGELDRILTRERQTLVGGDPDEDFFREVEGRRPTPRAAAPPSAPPPRPRDDRYDDDDDRYDPRSKKRRRRGFLEDLFDFDLG
jgi:uncharacterized protein